MRTQITETGAQIQTQGSKRLLLSKFHKHFGLAQELAYHLYQKTKNAKYLNQMVEWNQDGKSTVLYEALHKSKVQKFAGIPDSTLTQERQHLSKINFYKQKIYELQVNSSEETERIETYENRLAKQQADYDQLVKKLSRNYDKYYDIKYGNDNITIQKIQNQLTENECLLDYFITDSTILIYQFTTSDYQVYAIPKPTEFKKQIRDFIALMNTTPSNNKLRTSDFATQSYQLYQLLLEKPLPPLPKTINKLTLIPNGILGYIPFEVLLTTAPVEDISFKKMPYLLRDYTIGYAYSLKLYGTQNQQLSTSNKKLFAGFAPNYEGFAVPEHDSIGTESVVMLIRSESLPLPGAIEEVNTIAKLLNGQAFTNQLATETRFKQTAQTYKILHLSMHALLENQNPLYSKMLFSQTNDTLNDGLLNAAELYNMELNADLVALSACNTGLGQLSKGEGIMSLSRAFAYAGCSSTLMSLWKVSDYTTSDLMVSFYENLNQGLSKDEALCQAKLNYLNNTKVETLSHPYFWAGFITAGNMQPIEVNSPFKYEWLLIGFGVGLLIYFGSRIFNHT